jgi:hypothetical protein
MARGLSVKSMLSRAVGMRKSGRYRLENIAVLTMLCLASYGCSQANESGQSAKTSNAIVSTVVPMVTSTLSGPELDATKMAGLATWEAPQHEMETSVAQGTPPPIPTIIPIPTQHPPLWRPTLGISGDCATTNNLFDYGGCWVGIVNNEYVFVDTGAVAADPSKGAIRVYTATMDLLTFGTKEMYYAPSPAGRLHPTQVVWPVVPLVILDSNPPVYFAFDLDTRQWVSATPGPSPSVSPLPTQQP